jgi:exopolysaccharide production protein ExoQ
MATTTISNPIVRPEAGRTQAARHSLMGWALIFPLMFFAVDGVFAFEEDRVGGNPLSLMASSGTHQIGLLGYVVIPGIAYSIVLWLIISNARRVVPIALRMKMISLLTLLTICSAVWSQDPLRSAHYGLFYLIETLFAFALVAKFDPEEIISLVMTAGAVLCGLSLITVIAFPQSAVSASPHGTVWLGVFNGRTSAAKNFVYFLSPAIMLRRWSWKPPQLIYVALITLMIFKAHAITAQVVLIFYVAFMALLGASRKFGRRSSLVILGTSVVAAVLILCVGLQYLPSVLGGIGKDPTLTGRTEIWSLVLTSIAKRPLLGYGYYAFWQGLKGESANLIVASHWVFGYAHNGVLEIWLQVGLVGTAIFFVTLLQAMRNGWFCLRSGCSSGVEWYLGVIALTLVYNIDESTVLWPFDLLSILYVVACCGLAQAARRIREIKRIEVLCN